VGVGVAEEPDLVLLAGGAEELAGFVEIGLLLVQSQVLRDEVAHLGLDAPQLVLRQGSVLDQLAVESLAQGVLHFHLGAGEEPLHHHAEEVHQ